MRECPMKHQLQWVEGWKQPKMPHRLEFGIYWHRVMNVYYDVLMSKGPEPEKFASREIQRTPEEFREPLQWMLDGYAKHYGRERGWQVLDVERELIIDLPQLGDWRIKLKVKVDLVIADREGRIYVDDHKTRSNGMPSDDNAEVDPQLPLYAYGISKEGEQVFGARYSYALKPPKLKRDHLLDKRFKRRLVHLTKNEMVNAARDMYRTIETRYMEAERVGKDAPRNVGDLCGWKCDFTHPCKAGRKGRDTRQVLLDLKYSRWRDEDKAPKEVT